MPKVTVKKPEKPAKSTRVSTAGTSSSVVGKFNDHTAINGDDRDMLLQAFEKPTRIYSFMRRNQRPFLCRTLAYMPERKPVRKQSRNSFQINNMMSEQQKRKLYFILQFTGIFDKSLSPDIQTAQVGISLLKKLRQESEKKQVFLGYVSVPVNPGKNCPFKESAKLIVSDKSDANSSLLSLCFNVRLSNKVVDYDTANSDSEAVVENNKRKSLRSMYLLRHKFVGDCYIPVACATFIDEYGKEIIERQLYRNFLIHLATLVDFGLLNDFYYYTLVVQLQRMIVTNSEYIQQFRTSYLAQRHYAYLYGNQNISGNSQYDGNGETGISNDDRAETSSLVMSSSPITRRKLPDQNRKRGI